MWFPACRQTVLYKWTLTFTLISTVSLLILHPCSDVSYFYHYIYFFDEMNKQNQGKITQSVLSYYNDDDVVPAQAAGGS